MGPPNRLKGKVILAGVLLWRNVSCSTEWLAPLNMTLGELAWFTMLCWIEIIQELVNDACSSGFLEGKEGGG
jgi:hypothetical protein